MFAFQLLPKSPERLGRVVSIDGDFGKIQEHSTRRVFPFSLRTGAGVGVNEFGPYLDGEDQNHQFRKGDGVIFTEEGGSVSRLAPKRVFDKKALGLTEIKWIKITIPGRNSKKVVFIGPGWVIKQKIARFSKKTLRSSRADVFLRQSKTTVKKN